MLIAARDHDEIRRVLSELVAVLSLTAPSIRLPAERMESLLPDVRDCAAAISSDLGWLDAAGPAPAR